MLKQLILVVLALLILAAPILGGDLYKIKVQSELDVQLLKDAGVEPLVRLTDGYLAITEPQTARTLEESKLIIEPIASNINKADLAIDLRLDRANAERFSIIYEVDNLRLFRIDTDMLPETRESFSLMPVKNESLRFEYIPAQTLKAGDAALVDGLQELIDLIDQDSLLSYTEALQAFGSRYTGTSSNYASRDWIAAKFDEFGYDSVAIDSFYASSSNCMNVIAYKIGTHLPEHHIIIGAHRDAVSGSPGADDNGSGTAGVLEIARILKDIETDLSFVFILFDAEEQGLHGAYHYADEAYARGDSIVYMLNMDMIAYHPNHSQAKLYHGWDQTYSQLWQQIGDSLVGLEGVLSGTSGSSDHYPFSQNGYKVTFVHEYIFSTVYHSYQDSTTYLDFYYMARMVKASLATAYSASQTYIPAPSLAFDYPDDVPDVLTPYEQTMFEVVIDGIYDGVLVPGTEQIHYSINDGPVQTDAMSLITGNRYTATLPGLQCGDYMAFYVSAEEVSSGVVYDPNPAQPNFAFPANSETVLFSDGFESDLGWTVSAGLWERGTPTGGGGEYGGPDPSSGYSGPNVYGYNLNGDYTNSMPERHLTSPAIDCSEQIGVKLSFWRWLGVEQPIYDHAHIRISTDGSSWITIWENNSEITDFDWTYQEFDISSIADGQPTVYLRWTMGVTDGGWTYCGWNIDDVVVRAYDCDAGPAPLEITTESLPDWTAGYPFVEQLIATGGVGQHTWGDKYGELDGTGLSLSMTGLLSGTPLASGAASFTAQVIDEELDVDEKVFSFSINDTLKITTSSLAPVIVGDAYNEQLTASGGTGAMTWLDRDDDLLGTGLTLAPNGAITGTPLAAGLISFTARVVDGVSCSDEEPLTVDVLVPYTCGDANGDGNVNVADGVYIINYVFKGGPPPDPYCVGNTNDDEDVNVADAVYMINYVFSGGPPPVEGCCP